MWVSHPQGNYPITELRHPFRYSDDPDSGANTKLAASLRTVGVEFVTHSHAYPAIMNTYSRDSPYTPGVPGKVTYWLKDQSIFKQQETDRNGVSTAVLAHEYRRQFSELNFVQAPEWDVFLAALKEGNAERAMNSLYPAIMGFLAQGWKGADTTIFPIMLAMVQDRRKWNEEKARKGLMQSYEAVDIKPTIELDERLEAGNCSAAMDCLPFALIGYWAQCQANYTSLLHEWGSGKKEFASYDVPGTKSVITPTVGEEKFKQRFRLPLGPSRLNEAFKDLTILNSKPLFTL